MKTFVRVSLVTMFVFLLAGVTFMQPASAAPRLHFRLGAADGWAATGFSFSAGDALTFSAHGQAITGPLVDFPEAHSGPDGQSFICSTSYFPYDPCPLNDAPYGALIGKIGAGGTPFLIGAGTTLTLTESGELFLAVNDNLPYFSDNTGSFMVFITP